MNEATVIETREEVHLGIRKKMYLFTKRVFDIVVSGFCLIILLPIFLLICILIKLCLIHMRTTYLIDITENIYLDFPPLRCMKMKKDMIDLL